MSKPTVNFFFIYEDFIAENHRKAEQKLYTETTVPPPPPP